MKYWQYVAAGLLAAGCSRDPAPDDSYFITGDDYRAPADTTVVVAVADTAVAVGLSDTVDVQAETDSMHVSAEDSLYSATDSLEMNPDSLLAADTTSTRYWRFAAVEIQGSLYQSLESVSDVESDILGAHCVRNLVWEMNPWRGFIAGDSVKILYTTEESPRENMVVAFEYIPVSGSANHSFSGYLFTKTGDNWPSVWKPDGSELVKLLDRMPVGTFEEITSVFGEPRGNHIHQGVDYKAPEGTPVYSVTGGSVVRTNWNTPYNGNCVEIGFGGYSEIFLHLNSIAAAVVPGAVIDPGEQIGTIGNSGISTAPHLHYQINGPDGYAIDPYLYFSSHRRTLDAEDMVLFQQRVDLCREMMGE
jgi:murein DD-endopeptidase MepM/ murein hydrolase activator NlpD